MTDMHWFVRMSDNVPLHRFLGLQVKACEGGHGEIVVPIGENLLNAAGAVHGGIYYILCDITGTLAFSSLQGDDVFYVTHDINVSVLKPAFQGHLIAKADVIKSGKRLGFVECRIFDDNDDVLAVGRITKSILPGKKYGLKGKGEDITK